MKAIWLAIGFALVVAPGQANAKTWTVGPHDADFPLIGPAIAASAPHDVIRIAAGVYREDLLITHSLVLVGEDGATLFGTGRGTVIDIAAADCEIRGLTIDGTGSGAGNEMDAAIRVTTSGNRIIGNRIRRAFYGVVVAGASRNVIEGNDIAGLAAEPFGRRGDGIYLYRAPDNRVAHNRITGMRDAIYFQYAAGGVVEHNTVEESRYGLHDMFSNGTRIANNVFRTSSVGANLMNSRGLILENNEFSHNRGIAAVGLALKECDDSQVRGNRFVANGRGLQLDGSSGNAFTGNRFLQNDLAIRLAASAESNVFSRNQFSGNWSDIVASGRGSSTRWEIDGAGNTWSAYAGFDFDADGIGDTPHPLSGPFERIEGRNAMARLFLQSPAADALALVARMSPALEGLVDLHPLVVPASSSINSASWMLGIGLLASLTRGLWRRTCSS